MKLWAGSVVAAAGDAAAALVGLVLVVLAVAAYFLPTLVAAGRKHHQIGAIAVINVLAGWTFVGWVVALAMACSAVKPATATPGWTAPAQPGRRVRRLPAGAVIEIAGVARFQEAIVRACGSSVAEHLPCPVVAGIVAEPENPEDANAVAVFVGGNRVGYFSARDARDYRPVMNALAEMGYHGATCEALIVGREQAGEATHLGLSLQLAAPGELVDLIRAQPVPVT